MKIGIIGVGVIASAIVNGMCLKDDLTHDIYLSPRNEACANQLADKYKNVYVCRSNQEVADKSEYVIFSVLTRLGEDIIKPLHFHENHRIINLMSDRQLSEIETWIGKTKSLTHVVPLSFIEKRKGPIAIYPENADVIALFEPLGHVIPVGQVEQIQAMAAITGLMTSYYELLWQVVKWGEQAGLNEKDGIEYVSSFFAALSNHSKEGSLENLAKEMTPGGYNELVLKNIQSSSGFDLWVKPMDSIMKRLRK